MSTTAPALERGPDDGVDVLRAVGGEQQRLGARRDAVAVGAARSSRMPPTQLGRARLVGDARRRGPRRAASSASSSIWVDLPDPSPPSNAMNTPPPRSRRRAAESPRSDALTSVQHRDLLAVVHLAVGEQAGERARAARRRSARFACRRRCSARRRCCTRRLADLRRPTNGHGGQRQRPARRGSATAAARTPARASRRRRRCRAASCRRGRRRRRRSRRRRRRSIGERDLRHHRGQDRQTAAKTSASPNSRRRDSSRAIRGPNAMPEPSPTNTAPNSTP